MRVVVAEDQLLTREGIVHVLREAGVEVVGEASDASQLMALVATEKPDAAVVDIRMPPTHTDEGPGGRRADPARIPGHRSPHRVPAPRVGFRAPPPRGGRRRVGYLLKDRILDRGCPLDSLRRIVAGECVVDPFIVGRLLSRDVVRTRSARSPNASGRCSRTSPRD